MLGIFKKQKKLFVGAKVGQVVVKFGWTTIVFKTHIGAEVQKLDKFIAELQNCRKLSLKAYNNQLKVTHKK